jgi:hypothetical protein
MFTFFKFLTFIYRIIRILEFLNNSIIFINPALKHHQILRQKYHDFHVNQCDFHVIQYDFHVIQYDFNDL